jgi:hypothetical protein
MALTAYETALQNLLQAPGAPATLYPTSNLDLWINTARGQLAGEGECIRAIGTISTVIGQRNYNFSAINFGVSATTGIQGALNVRRISYNVASGQAWMPPREWEYFDLYYMNNPVPTQGAPARWAQYGQGAATPATGSSSTGSFYLDPPPDAIYTLNCDCTCYPIVLANDTTVEAIPYLWTDCVPFFAAYYAFLTSQTGARQADAERMYGYYKEFLNRARMISNPSVNRSQYEQAADPASINKLGVQQRAGAGNGGGQ